MTGRTRGPGGSGAQPGGNAEVQPAEPGQEAVAESAERAERLQAQNEPALDPQGQYAAPVADATRAEGRARPTEPPVGERHPGTEEAPGAPGDPTADQAPSTPAEVTTRPADADADADDGTA